MPHVVEQLDMEGDRAVFRDHNVHPDIAPVSEENPMPTRTHKFDREYTPELNPLSIVVSGFADVSNKNASRVKCGLV